MILLGAIHWYQVSKISQLAEKHKKQNLDIGRTLFQFIRHDLQSSGYRGCRTQDQSFPIRRNFEKNGIPYKFLKTDRAVFGFKADVGVCQQHIPQKFCDNIRKKTDVLIIYNIAQKINFLKQTMVNPEDVLFIQAGGRIQKNAMVLVSDVQQGDFFIANDVENEKIFHQVGANSTAVLSKPYKQGTEITELQTIAYYLGIPERSSAFRGTYSLFRSDIRQKAEEIVEGVVNFSVEYGLFESNDPSRAGACEKFQYYTAAEIGPEQWALVRMVRLKIETKGEAYYGILQKNSRWEYAFAVRNGYRVSSGIDIDLSHLIDRSS